MPETTLPINPGTSLVAIDPPPPGAVWRGTVPRAGLLEAGVDPRGDGVATGY
jgi:hypothetical protein